MRKALLASVALSAVLTAAPALAADLGQRMITKAPPAAVPFVQPFTWTGFYLGVNAGYGFGTGSSAITTGQVAANVANVAGGARPANVDLRPEGFIGGGQVGYNWQFGSFVTGIEADLAYTDFSETRTVVTTPLSGVGSLNNTFRQHLEYFGTVRGRLGIAADRTLFYATGGFAYGGVDNRVDFFGPAGNLQFTGATRRNREGYTVGGGIEHAFAGNWSVKAEYLYFDLGRETVNVAVIAGSGGGGTGYDTRFRNDGHIVRAGLNYRFGGVGAAPGPF